MNLRCLRQPAILSELDAAQRNYLEDQLGRVYLDDADRFPIEALMAVSTMDRPQAEALKVPPLMCGAVYLHLRACLLACLPTYFLGLVCLLACLPACMYGW